MNITKNVQFSCNIKTGGSFKEFNFRKQQGLPNPGYHIDVSDERGNRHVFSMQLIEGLWKIQESKIPDWILFSEPMLHQAIEQQ